MVESTMATDARSPDDPSKGQVAEVVVTAQRRAETLQTVPISVTAFTADQIQRDRIDGIAGYLGRTPDVSFVNNGSRDRVDIAIRGVSNDLNPYSDIRPSSFAFYVDDFNVATITTNPEVADLSRIEVLRGPQPTYFGRNAEAGAINIYTQPPTDKPDYDISVDYSSFNTLKADAAINIPVAPGLFDLRVSGQSETSDGNIRNINPIGGGNEYNYYNGRIAARFTPVSRLVWDATLDYSHERQGMRDGVPTGVLTSTWAEVYYACAVPPGIAKHPTCLADPDGVGFFPGNDDRTNFNTPQKVGSNYYFATSRAVYSFDDAALTVVGGYGESEVFNKGDVDGGSFDFFNENDILRRQTSSIEARLASTTKGAFDYTLGLNVGQDLGKTTQNTTYGTQAILTPFQFDNTPGTDITGTFDKQHDTYESVFAQGVYHLGTLFDFILGGRYTHETVSGTFLDVSNATTITDDEPHLSSHFNDFSPAGTLKFKPRKDLELYGTVSKGYKPGGVQSAQTLLTSNYKSETLWNYEVGLKNELFNHRLRYDLAAFYERWKNIQEAVNFEYEAPGNTIESIEGVNNAASAQSYGVDASADLRVDRNITLSGHMSYDRAVFLHYNDALVDGTTIDASRLPLLDAPKITAGASGEYRHDLFGMQGFGLIDWNYRGQTYSNLFALKYQYYPFIAPSFSNVDLRFGLEKGHVSGIFYIENLLDAKYFTNSFEKAFYSGVQVVPSYQRIGFSLRYKY